VLGSPVNVIGWDIGGANLKASDGESRSIEIAFPLWQRPGDLEEALRQIAAQFALADHWSVTMTGELADCFATKAEGVRHIVSAVQTAAGNTPVSIWTTAGEFVSPQVACDTPILAAAANWHALATWCGRSVPEGNSLLVDIGSTTTDIIPLVNGFPDPEGRTDAERLLSGELVYTGIRRTPLNTLANTVLFRGRQCPMAAETFATTIDLYILRDEIPEAPDQLETANGRPATKKPAIDRIARMFCCDREECTPDEAFRIADELAMAQRLRIAAAMSRVARRFDAPPKTLILSGSGEFLARAAASQAGKSIETASQMSMSELLGKEHSSAACAYSLARLGRERL
jgi:(4-(4-[2-(gamma-L-glutamylamino)ethyl]phenoxymethyl)furan-2-yl)methanamine synthase